MTRTFRRAIILGTLAIAITGCNTVKGLGEDIKSVGNAGEKAID